MEDEEILDQFSPEDIKFIKNFLYKETYDHILIKRFIGEGHEIIIPDTFKNKPVTFVDRGFWSGSNYKDCDTLIIGDNLISFYSPLRDAKNIKKIVLGEKLNCIESLIKNSGVEELDLGKNTTYKFTQGCLITKNGETILWNQPWIKKVPYGVVNIGPGCQFFDSVYIPDTVNYIHAESFRSKTMIVYFQGRKISWVNVHIQRTLTTRDIRKGKYDNEVFAKTQELKFRKAHNKVRLDVRYNVRFSS